MRIGMYPKLAFDSIKKNKRLYLPYILTCIGMVMMYYIVKFLNVSETISNIPGGGETALLMGFGAWVIAIFSVVFLFYTNSFLMKRRKKEFGLYNILGMGKNNIGVIIIFENVIIFSITLICGLFLGVVFSKLSELIILRLIRGNVGFNFDISFKAIKSTLLIYCGVFALLTVYSMISVKANTAINLLKSENAGEKPPKANWVFGIIGIALLICAYVLALIVKDAIQSLALFFIAVILVIIGTYLVLIAGSVMICKILQKCKNYYYQKKHFVSVSSMTYRMKRNGAGLASICILSTMVLVTISTTSCIYFGSADSINNRFPYEYNMRFSFSGDSETFFKCTDALKKNAQEKLYEANGTMKECVEYKYAEVSGLLVDGYAQLEYETNSFSDTEILTNSIYDFDFISIESYNHLSGKNVSLNEDEIIICPQKEKDFPKTVNIQDKLLFNVVQVDNIIFANNESEVGVVPVLYVVVNNLEKTIESLSEFKYKGEQILSVWYRFDFNTNLEKDAQKELGNVLINTTADVIDEYTENTFSFSYRVNCKAQNADDYYSSSGGIIFIGIMLSVVFAVAAALIIYYKQLTEGYEDQDRFLILKNIGMTEQEIKSNINSQLLVVFFIPLLLSCCHLAFAFKMIRLILILFGITNIGLFAIITVLSVIAFSLLYVAFYKATSNNYYNIVCNKE